jgi:hypothetical protein
VRGPWPLALAILVGLLVRTPFWIESLRTPVDGDTAIVGLMARHPGEGTTMWGQPYGSPLDAWVATPFVVALGSTTSALRLPVFLLGLALVPIAWALGRALHPDAAFPAALLVACPPPYFLLLSALPPPFYATTLALCGILLVLTLRIADRLEKGETPRKALATAGALAGLALWTHLMSASVVAMAAAYLMGRARGRRRVLVVALGPLLLASAPWWGRALADGDAARIVRVADRDETTLGHLRKVVPRLHEPVGGLLGTHVPVVADAEDFVLRSPGGVAGLVILIYGGLVVLAARRSGGHPPAGLLLATVALVVIVFPFPLRSGPHTIRFLTPAYLPLAALVAWAAAAGGRPRRGLIAVLALAGLHLVPGSKLLETWRATDRAGPPFLLPDLAPVRGALESRGLRHAYASYGPAYRLTWESAERIVASQPWNERFRHYPLPRLDEVRFAKDVAWVLTPSVPTDLPSPREFEEAMASLGGAWKRTEAGPAVLYHDFRPPFGPDVEAWPGVGVAGDGDLATALSPETQASSTYALPEPRPLDAVTLVAGLDGPRLLRSMDVETSADGKTFETVARRRRREEREDLRWVNGHPQAVLDHDLVSIPLGGRTVAAIRITPFASTDPWTLGELLLHPARPEGERVPWGEWLPPHVDWKERARALAHEPRTDREDWYWRVLLAARRGHPASATAGAARVPQ